MLWYYHSNGICLHFFSHLDSSVFQSLALAFLSKRLLLFLFLMCFTEHSWNLIILCILILQCIEIWGDIIISTLLSTSFLVRSKPGGKKKISFLFSFEGKIFNKSSLSKTLTDTSQNLEILPNDCMLPLYLLYIYLENNLAIFSRQPDLPGWAPTGLF